MKGLLEKITGRITDFVGAAVVGGFFANFWNEITQLVERGRIKLADGAKHVKRMYHHGVGHSFRKIAVILIVGCNIIYGVVASAIHLLVRHVHNHGLFGYRIWPSFLESWRLTGWYVIAIGMWALGNALLLSVIVRLWGVKPYDKERWEQYLAAHPHQNADQLKAARRRLFGPMGRVTPNVFTCLLAAPWVFGIGLMLNSAWIVTAGTLTFLFSTPHVGMLDWIVRFIMADGLLWVFCVPGMVFGFVLAREVGARLYVASAVLVGWLSQTTLAAGWRTFHAAVKPLVVALPFVSDKKEEVEQYLPSADAVSKTKIKEVIEQAHQSLFSSLSMSASFMALIPIIPIYFTVNLVLYNGSLLDYAQRRLGKMDTQKQIEEKLKLVYKIWMMVGVGRIAEVLLALFIVPVLGFVNTFIGSLNWMAGTWSQGVWGVLAGLALLVGLMFFFMVVVLATKDGIVQKGMISLTGIALVAVFAGGVRACTPSSRGPLIDPVAVPTRGSPHGVAAPAHPSGGAATVPAPAPSSAQPSGGDAVEAIDRTLPAGG